MTNEERANNWLIDWLDWLPASERDGFVEVLVAEFAAVRTEERLVIVDVLRGRAQQTARTRGTARAAELHDAANALLRSTLEVRA